MDLATQIEQLHPACFGWALGCCDRDREEARDVLQTTYLKVLNGEARFGGRSSFKTWLFGVIRHTAAERRRRRLAGLAVLGRWLAGSPAPLPSSDPAIAAENSEVAAALIAAVGTLPRRQRDLMWLVFYQDLTIEEAAGVLAISLGSARTHYQRGKKKLRTLLGSPEPTP